MRKPAIQKESSIKLFKNWTAMKHNRACSYLLLLTVTANKTDEQNRDHRCAQNWDYRNVITPVCFGLHLHFLTEGTFPPLVPRRRWRLRPFLRRAQHLPHLRRASSSPTLVPPTKFCICSLNRKKLLLVRFVICDLCQYVWRKKSCVAWC